MAETDTAAKRPASAAVAPGQAVKPEEAGATAFPVTLHFQNMPALLHHTVAVGGERSLPYAAWSMAPGPRHDQRLMISAPASAAVSLKLFILTNTHLTIAVNQAMPALDIALYVRTASPWVFGSVVLPPGTIVTPQSNLDRTNVVGTGSWSLFFDMPPAQRP
ncbi:hypothetical protein [Ferrovibrio xuzhouensis]|uniref:Uncharacterized protein n=1 Tax=Ferrovibrio xuzhouensis TaxID=1576914 RepID=A0ABV7VIU2_9PROT